MPRTISALMAICVIAVAAPAFAQNTKQTLDDHENRITNLEGDVQDLDGRVTALEGNGNGQGGPLVFVGYSMETVTGHEGIVGLTQACHGDFGTTSRVCTSKEFILSSDIEAPASDAWVNPYFIENEIDFSGQDGPPNGSCNSWGAGGNLGLAIRSNGAFVQATCDNSRSVTCCAPAP